MDIHKELLESIEKINSEFAKADIRGLLRCYSDQPQVLTSHYSPAYTTEGLSRYYEQKIGDGYRNPISNTFYAQIDDELAYAIGETTFEIVGNISKHFNWIKVFERGIGGSWLLKSVFSMDSQLSNAEKFPNLFEVYKVYAER